MNLNKVVFKFVSISFSILVALLVVVGLVKLGTFCYDFGYRVFTETAIDEEPGKEVVVQVTADMSEGDIGKMLEEKGLIRDNLLFAAQLKLSAYSGKLLPGIYTLNTSMVAKEMMAIMATEPEESTEEDTSEAEQATEDTQESADDTESTEDTGEEP